MFLNVQNLPLLHYAPMERKGMMYMLYSVLLYICFDSSIIRKQYVGYERLSQLGLNNVLLHHQHHPVCTLVHSHMGRYGII